MCAIIEQKNAMWHLNGKLIVLISESQLFKGSCLWYGSVLQGFDKLVSFKPENLVFYL